MAEVAGGDHGGDRLSSREISAFVAHGFLRFDEIIPAELCKAALAEIAAGFEPTPYGAPPDSRARGWPGHPVAELWPGSRAIGPILRLPPVSQIVESLLGPGALYDHHYAHVIPPRQRWSQPWHADAILDPRPFAFDIQLLFFFHDTPREAGGTMLLPGSHFRRVNESDISRVQNFRGQLPTVCRAGTLLVCHHGIWHCGQPNHTEQPRTMLKIRLGPAAPQLRRFDLADADDPAVIQTLRIVQPWLGSAEARLEVVNRIRLWRYLTGNPQFDIDYWLGRIEGPPRR